MWASSWRTWTVPRAQGCIQPGDTVYFMAGVYESGAGVFDGGDSKAIRFEGTSGAPICIAPDPQAAGDWPVTFRGSFTLGDAWGIIAGIEFEGTGAGNVVMVNASHVTLDGCLVRGVPADVDPDSSGHYDCVKKWVTIGANGWQNAEIYHNTIYQTFNNVLIVHSAGFDTTDPIAAAYCHDNPCDPCGNQEPNCWHLDFAARDVKFKNNIIHSPGSYAIRAYSAALEGFEAASNLYYSPDGDVEFRLDGNIHTLASFPHESDSQDTDPGLTDLATPDLSLRDGSVAIDSGVDLGVTTDFLGLLRDTAADIGAYEYGAVPAGGGGAGASGGSGTTGSGAAAGSAAGGTGPAGSPEATEDDSGCDCRLAFHPTPRGPVAGWLLIGLLSCVRPRRPRTSPDRT